MKIIFNRLPTEKEVDIIGLMQGYVGVLLLTYLSLVGKFP